MKGLILTEGGKDIGFGHIARCTSLYQLFGEKEIETKIIVNGDESLESLLRGKNYQIINWLERREEIFCAIRDVDIVVIDSYLANYDFYKKVSELVRIPVYIGNNKRLHYPQGIVVKESLYAEELKYPEKEDVVYLLGSQYAMLRGEFCEVPEKEIKTRVERVMVTFGGKDIQCLTPKVLNFLNENYPEFKKNIIIGNAFHNMQEIESLKDDQINLIYYPDAEGMKNAMLASDICISGGGQTLYELARVGVPTIGICFANDQKRNLESWQKRGFIEYAGWFNDEDLLKKIMCAINKLMVYEERIGRSEIGRNYVDGKGAERIVERIVSLRGGF